MTKKKDIRIVEIQGNKARCLKLGNREKVEGLTLSELFNLLLKDNTINYIHNLALQGSGLTHFLLWNGFKHSTEFQPKHGEFKKVQTDNGAVYNIRINWKNEHINFYDTNFILNFSIDELRRDFINVSDEVDSLEVVAQSLEIMHREGYKQKSMSSNAWHFYTRQKFKGKNGKYSKMEMRKTFPLLYNEFDNFIRESYRGGWVYMEDNATQYNGEGITLDVNSLFPYVMESKALPYGKPKTYRGKYEKDENYPLYIQAILFKWIELKPNKVPCAVAHGISKLIETNYVTKRQKMVKMIITSVEFELIKECYNFEVLEYGNGMKFKQSTDLFTEYIQHFRGMKENNTGTLRQISKLFLNTLYGKFATSSFRIGYDYKLDESGKVRKILMPKQKHGEMYYTAMASFITAYARTETINAANSNIDRFLYSDTDSIHLKGTELPEGMEIHPKTFGSWKIEKIFNKCKFLGLKTYAEHDAEGWEFKVAGLPKEAIDELNIDNFEIGNKIQCKINKNINGKIEKVELFYTLASSKIGKI